METHAGFAHAAEGDGELRGRQPSEEELEDLENQQRQRRRRNDMLARLRLCPPPRRQHAFEQRSADAARLASSCLRSRVTIPAHVEEQQNWQATIDSAERLPRACCAFRNCRDWDKEDEKFAAQLPARPADAYWDRVLRAHIWRQRRVQIQEVALVEEDWVWDVYTESGSWSGRPHGSQI